LASGLLTGKYKAGIPSDSRGALEGFDWLRERLTDESRLEKVMALEPLAAGMGASLAQFSLAWCLQNPYVSSVLTGASRVEQVHENLKAIDFVDSFTPDVMIEIQRIFHDA
jgi:aryl-alcohol dehydrogenase-like predicted oxidoreductase